jgi:hypothetical protein
MNSITERMIRASKLDVNLYEEVEADKTAMNQAVTVVVLSGLAAGIGSLGALGIKGLLIGTVSALVGWFIWAYITYIVGTKLLPEPQTEADYGQLLRTIGFSSAPGLIRVIGIIPFLYGIATIAGGIWMLVAMVIAVRQALDYKSTWRAVGVCIIGWIIQAIVMWLFFAIFGASPPASM